MTGEIKIVKIDLEEYKKTQELLASQCYIDGDCLVLNVRYEYSITLDRLLTHEMILDWVLHLSGKNWFNMELMQLFIYLAKSQINNQN